MKTSQQTLETDSLLLEEKVDTLFGLTTVKYDKETPKFYNDWGESIYAQTESQNKSKFSLDFESSDGRKNKYNFIFSSYNIEQVKRKDECDNLLGSTLTKGWNSTDSSNN